MLEYRVPTDFLKDLAEHHRHLQTAICILANQKLDLTPEVPEFIFRWEGGVIVNRREITIKADYVVDSTGMYERETSPEEQAVVDSIMELVEAWKAQGVACVTGYTPPTVLPGDPLRSMFEKVLKAA
jgi:hypothetical protein